MQTIHIDIEPISLVQIVVYSANLLIWLCISFYFRRQSKHYPIGKKIITLFDGVMWTSFVFFISLTFVHAIPTVLGINTFTVPQWVWVIAYLPAQIAGLSLLWTLYRGK